MAHIVGNVSRCQVATTKDGEVLTFSQGAKAGQPMINFSVEGINMMVGDRFITIEDLPQEGQQVAVQTQTVYKAGKRPLVILTDWQAYSPFR